MTMWTHNSSIVTSYWTLASLPNWAIRRPHRVRIEAVGIFCSLKLEMTHTSEGTKEAYRILVTEKAW